MKPLNHHLLLRKSIAFVLLFTFSLTNTIAYGDLPRSFSSTAPETISHVRPEYSPYTSPELANFYQLNKGRSTANTANLVASGEATLDVNPFRTTSVARPEFRAHQFESVLDRLRDTEKQALRQALFEGFGKRVASAKIPNPRFLDFGAGVGDITAHLAPLFHETVAVEKDRVRASILKKRQISRLRVVDQDFFARQPIDELGMFDAILISHSLIFEPFERRNFLLKKAIEKLSASGHLAIAVNNIDPLPGTSAHVRKTFMTEHEFRGKERATSIEETIQSWGYPVETQVVTVTHRANTPQEMAKLVAAVLPKEDRRRLFYEQRDRLINFANQFLKAPGGGYELKINFDIMWVSQQKKSAVAASVQPKFGDAITKQVKGLTLGRNENQTIVAGDLPVLTVKRFHDQVRGKEKVLIAIDGEENDSIIWREKGSAEWSEWPGIAWLERESQILVENNGTQVFYVITDFRSASDRVRITVQTNPPNIPVHRGEVLERIIAERRHELRKINSDGRRTEVYTALQRAIASHDVRTILAEFKKAAVSELDFFLFMSATNRVFLETPSLMEKFASIWITVGLEVATGTKRKKLIQLVREITKAHGLSRPQSDALKHLSDISTFLENGKLHFYNLAAAQNMRMAINQKIFSKRDVIKIVKKLLLQNGQPTDFFLDSLKTAAKNPRLTAEDIQFPVTVTRIQMGQFQTVFAVLTTLRDGTVIPFALLVARNSRRSEVVRQEFENLSRHRNDPHAVRMFQLGSVPVGRKQIYAYSSEFLNDSAEGIYRFVRRGAEIHLWWQGTFSVNSSHPLRLDRSIGSQRPVAFQSILASQISTLVHFYDEEAKTRIGRLSIPAGDINIDERAFERLSEQRGIRIIPTKLIAWRRTAKNVRPADFIRYLFELSYLISPRSGGRVNTNPPYDRLIVESVFAGIKHGLIKKYGAARGMKKAAEWMDAYLEKVTKGKFPSDPLFKPELVRQFIQSLPRSDVRPELRTIGDFDARALKDALWRVEFRQDAKLLKEKSGRRLWFMRRKLLDISHKEVGELLNPRYPISHQVVKSWEKNRTPIPPGTFEKLEKIVRARFSDELKTALFLMDMTTTEFGRFLNPEKPVATSTFSYWFRGKGKIPPEVIFKTRAIIKSKTSSHVRNIREFFGFGKGTFGFYINPKNPANGQMVSLWERGYRLPSRERMREIRTFTRAKSGARLKLLRKRMELTQVQLGRLVNPDKPITQSTWAAWENNPKKNPVPYWVIARINEIVKDRARGELRLSRQTSTARRAKPTVWRSELRMDIEIPTDGGGIRWADFGWKATDQLHNFIQKYGKLSPSMEEARKLVAQSYSNFREGGHAGPNFFDATDSQGRSHNEFWLWFLDHLFDSEMRLGETEQKWIANEWTNRYQFLTYGEDPKWEWKNWKDDETLWYFFVRLLVLEEKLAGLPSSKLTSSHLRLIEAIYKSLISLVTVQFQQGERTQNPKFFFEGRFYQLAGYRKSLHPFVARILENWEEWSNSGSAALYDFQSEFDSTGQTDSNQVVASADKATELAQQLMELKNLVMPRTPDAMHAWDHPLEYLAQRTNDAHVVYLQHSLSREIVDTDTFPDYLQFELDFIDEMAKQGFVSWILPSAEDILALLQGAFPRAETQPSVNALLERAQRYFDDNTDENSMRIVFGLPNGTPDSPAVWNALQFLRRLKSLKREHRAQIKLLTLALQTSSLLAEMERESGKKLVLGNLSSTGPRRSDGDELGSFDDPKIVRFRHLRTARDYSRESFNPLHAFRHVAHLIGRERGGFGDYDSSAVPFLHKDALQDFLTKYQGKLPGFNLEIFHKLISQWESIVFTSVSDDSNREEVSDPQEQPSEADDQGPLSPVPAGGPNASTRPKSVPRPELRSRDVEEGLQSEEPANEEEQARRNFEKFKAELAKLPANQNPAAGQYSILRNGLESYLADLLSDPLAATLLRSTFDWLNSHPPRNPALVQVFKKFREQVESSLRPKGIDASAADHATSSKDSVIQTGGLRSKSDLGSAMPTEAGETMVPAQTTPPSIRQPNAEEVFLFDRLPKLSDDVRVKILGIFERFKQKTQPGSKEKWFQKLQEQVFQAIQKAGTPIPASFYYAPAHEQGRLAAHLQFIRTALRQSNPVVTDADSIADNPLHQDVSSEMESQDETDDSMLKIPNWKYWLARAGLAAFKIPLKILEYAVVALWVVIEKLLALDTLWGVKYSKKNESIFGLAGIGLTIDCALILFAAASLFTWNAGPLLAASSFLIPLVWAIKAYIIVKKHEEKSKKRNNVLKRSPDETRSYYPDLMAWLTDSEFQRVLRDFGYSSTPRAELPRAELRGVRGVPPHLPPKDEGRSPMIFRRLGDTLVHVGAGIYVPQSIAQNLKRTMQSALETYSNVHRGKGQHSLVSTELLEEARVMTLHYFGLDSKDHVVIFGNQRTLGDVLKHLPQKAFYRIIFSHQIGLSLGVGALAVKRSDLPEGTPLNLGGGTVGFVTRQAVQWAEFPDRLEPGTPNIVGVIVFAKALDIIRSYGINGFSGLGLLRTLHFNEIPELLNHDSLVDFRGEEMLEKLAGTLIGRNSKVPTLGGENDYVNFDNAASTPAFAPVFDVASEILLARLDERAREALLDEAEKLVREFFHLPSSHDVIFSGNTSDASNLLARNVQRLMQHARLSGEEIVVLGSDLEHNSNHLPYRFIEGVSYVRLPIDHHGFFDLRQFEQILKEYNSPDEMKRKYGNQRIRLVALSGASNALGSINDFTKFVQIAHRYGAQVSMDAAQLVAHRAIDVEKLDLDYLLFSAHKMYAPFGSGALIARRSSLYLDANELEKARQSGNDNLVGIAALAKAVQLLMRIGMDKIAEHEINLNRYALEQLKNLGDDEIEFYGVTEPDLLSRKTGIIPFNLKHWPRNVVALWLAINRAIGTRDGFFCAPLAVTSVLGADDDRLSELAAMTTHAHLISPGMLRVSFGLYNNKEEVDVLVESLRQLIKLEKHPVMVKVAALRASFPIKTALSPELKKAYAKLLGVSEEEVEEAYRYLEQFGNFETVTGHFVKNAKTNVYGAGVLRHEFRQDDLIAPRMAYPIIDRILPVMKNLHQYYSASALKSGRLVQQILKPEFWRAQAGLSETDAEEAAHLLSTVYQEVKSLIELELRKQFYWDTTLTEVRMDRWVSVTHLAAMMSDRYGADDLKHLFKRISFVTNILRSAPDIVFGGRAEFFRLRPGNSRGESPSTVSFDNTIDLLKIHLARVKKIRDQIAQEFTHKEGHIFARIDHDLVLSSILGATEEEVALDLRTLPDESSHWFVDPQKVAEGVDEGNFIGFVKSSNAILPPARNFVQERLIDLIVERSQSEKHLKMSAETIRAHLKKDSAALTAPRAELRSIPAELTTDQHRNRSDSESGLRHGTLDMNGHDKNGAISFSEKAIAKRVRWIDKLYERVNRHYRMVAKTDFHVIKHVSPLQKFIRFVTRFEVPSETVDLTIEQILRLASLTTIPGGIVRAIVINIIIAGRRHIFGAFPTTFFDQEKAEETKKTINLGLSNANSRRERQQVLKWYHKRYGYLWVDTMISAFKEPPLDATTMSTPTKPSYRRKKVDAAADFFMHVLNNKLRLGRQYIADQKDRDILDFFKRQLLDDDSQVVKGVMGALVRISHYMDSMTLGSFRRVLKALLTSDLVVLREEFEEFKDIVIPASYQTSEVVRGAAARALGAGKFMDHHDNLYAAVDALKTEKSTWVQTYSVGLIEQIVSDVESESIPKALREELITMLLEKASSDPRDPLAHIMLRVSAIKALAMLKLFDQRILNQLSTLLRTDPNETVQEAAMWALARFYVSTPEAINQISVFLKDVIFYVRQIHTGRHNIILERFAWKLLRRLSRYTNDESIHSELEKMVEKGYGGLTFIQKLILGGLNQFQKYSRIQFMPSYHEWFRRKAERDELSRPKGVVNPVALLDIDEILRDVSGDEAAKGAEIDRVFDVLKKMKAQGYTVVIPDRYRQQYTRPAYYYPSDSELPLRLDLLARDVDRLAHNLPIRVRSRDWLRGKEHERHTGVVVPLGRKPVVILVHGPQKWEVKDTVRRFLRGSFSLKDYPETKSGQFDRLIREISVEIGPLKSQLETLAKDETVQWNDEQVQEIFEAVKNGAIDLKGEDVDVIKVAPDGSEIVIGSVDRSVAHVYGLLHRASVAFLVTPDGKLLLRRRPHNHSMPLKLSIFGGHGISGQTYEETIERELIEDLGLPPDFELGGKLVRIGEEGQFRSPDGGSKNLERRSVYLYFAKTEEELKHIRWQSETLVNVKKERTEDEYRAWLESQQDSRAGYGGVWSYHEVSLDWLLENVSGTASTVTDEFKDGLKDSPAQLTEDLLVPLLQDPEVVKYLRGVIASLFNPLTRSEFRSKNSSDFQDDSEIDLTGRDVEAAAFFTFAMRLLRFFKRELVNRKNAREALVALKNIETTRKELESRHPSKLHLYFGHFDKWENRVAGLSYYLFGEVLSEDQLIDRVNRQINSTTMHYLLNTAADLASDLVELTHGTPRFRFRDLYQYRADPVIWNCILKLVSGEFLSSPRPELRQAAKRSKKPAPPEETWRPSRRGLLWAGVAAVPGVGFGIYYLIQLWRRRALVQSEMRADSPAVPDPSVTKVLHEIPDFQVSLYRFGHIFHEDLEPVRERFVKEVTAQALRGRDVVLFFENLGGELPEATIRYMNAMINGDGSAAPNQREIVGSELQMKAFETHWYLFLRGVREEVSRQIGRPFIFRLAWEVSDEDVIQETVKIFKLEDEAVQAFERGEPMERAKAIFLEEHAKSDEFMMRRRNQGMGRQINDIVTQYPNASVFAMTGYTHVLKPELAGKSVREMPEAEQKAVENALAITVTGMTEIDLRRLHGETLSDEDVFWTIFKGKIAAYLMLLANHMPGADDTRKALAAKSIRERMGIVKQAAERLTPNDFEVFQKWLAARTKLQQPWYFEEMIYDFFRINNILTKRETDAAFPWEIEKAFQQRRNRYVSEYFPKSRSELRGKQANRNPMPKFLRAQEDFNRGRIEQFDRDMKTVIQKKDPRLGKSLEELLSEADVVIGIPYTARETSNIEKLIFYLREALRSQGRKAAILVGTQSASELKGHIQLEQLHQTVPTFYATPDIQIAPFARPDPPEKIVEFGGKKFENYGGKPWTERAFMLLAQSARQGKGAHLLIVDADIIFANLEFSARSLVDALLSPLVKGKADFVTLDALRDFYFDDGIVHFLSYLLMSSAYGLKIHQPYGGEFAVSRDALDKLLSDHTLSHDDAYDLELQLLSRLITGFRGGKGIHEVQMRAKTHRSVNPESVFKRLRPALGHFFDDILRHSSEFSHRPVTAKPLTVHASRRDAAFFKSSPYKMSGFISEEFRLVLLKAYAERIEQFLDVYKRTLGEKEAAALFARASHFKALLNKPNGVPRFDFPPEEWALMSAKFLGAYRSASHYRERERILDAYLPIWFAGVLHFSNEANNLEFRKANRLIDTEYVPAFQKALSAYRSVKPVESVIARSEFRMGTVQSMQGLHRALNSFGEVSTRVSFGLAGKGEWYIRAKYLESSQLVISIEEDIGSARGKPLRAPVYLRVRRWDSAITFDGESSVVASVELPRDTFYRGARNRIQPLSSEVIEAMADAAREPGVTPKRLLEVGTAFLDGHRQELRDNDLSESASEADENLENQSVGKLTVTPMPGKPVRYRLSSGVDIIGLKQVTPKEGGIPTFVGQLRDGSSFFITFELEKSISTNFPPSVVMKLNGHEKAGIAFWKNKDNPEKEHRVSSPIPFYFVKQLKFTSETGVISITRSRGGNAETQIKPDGEIKIVHPEKRGTVKKKASMPISELPPVEAMIRGRLERLREEWETGKAAKFLVLRVHGKPQTWIQNEESFDTFLTKAVADIQDIVYVRKGDFFFRSRTSFNKPPASLDGKAAPVLYADLYRRPNKRAEIRSVPFTPRAELRAWREALFMNLEPEIADYLRLIYFEGGLRDAKLRVAIQSSEAIQGNMNSAIEFDANPAEIASGALAGRVAAAVESRLGTISRVQPMEFIYKRGLFKIRLKKEARLQDEDAQDLDVSLNHIQLEKNLFSRLKAATKLPATDIRRILESEVSAFIFEAYRLLKADQETTIESEEGRYSKKLEGFIHISLTGTRAKAQVALSFAFGIGSTKQPPQSDFAILLTGEATMAYRSELRSREDEVGYDALAIEKGLDHIDDFRSDPLPLDSETAPIRLKHLLVKSPEKRLGILNDYVRFMDRNESFIRNSARWRGLAVFERAVSALIRKLEQPSHLTSFPADELYGVFLIEIFHQKEWAQEIDRLAALDIRLTQNLSHEDLFMEINRSVERLAALVAVPEGEANQVRQELTLMIYRELLRRKLSDKRTVQIGLTTSRDGQQSNIATRMNGLDQRQVLDGQLMLGTTPRLETWGGAVVQSAFLKAKRGDKPEDPWVNLRRQTGLLRSKLLEVLKPLKGLMDEKDWELIFDRYQFKPNRHILSEEELRSLLRKYKIPDQIEAEAVRLYGIRQSMLLRGQYIVSLRLQSKSILELFIRTAYKNGVDTFRIFDAFNDTRKIIPAIQFARSVHARVQPVIHYTTDFPGGIARYVELAQELVNASGEDLDALVIKDAGGLLEPDQAFHLVSALRKSGLQVPLLIHTHDTQGNRQISLLEAIRANGSEFPIAVDLGVGKGNLSAPFGQPDLRNFFDLIESTGWQGDIKINKDKLTELEKLIDEKITPKYPRLSVTSEGRQQAVRARLPGGMKTNFIDDQIQKSVAGYASLIQDKYGIVVVDDEKQLTETGRQFAEALLPLLFDEIRKVTKDVGGISLVTPTSQWVGVQSFNNVIHWLLKDWIGLKKDSASIQLFHNEKFPKTDRQRQYGPLQAPLQNYLIIWAQDSHLQYLYPEVDRMFVLKAFQDLKEKSLNLEMIETGLKTGTKESVDAGLITRAVGAADPAAQVKMKEGPGIELDKAKPLFAEARQKNSAINGTDEDLLLWVIFPTDASHLFDARKSLLDELDSVALENRHVLLNLKKKELLRTGARLNRSEFRETDLVPANVRVDYVNPIFGFRKDELAGSIKSTMVDGRDRLTQARPGVPVKVRLAGLSVVGWSVIFEKTAERRTPMGGRKLTFRFKIEEDSDQINRGRAALLPEAEAGFRDLGLVPTFPEPASMTMIAENMTLVASYFEKINPRAEFRNDEASLLLSGFAKDPALVIAAAHASKTPLALLASNRAEQRILEAAINPYLGDKKVLIETDPKKIRAEMRRQGANVLVGFGIEESHDSVTAERLLNSGIINRSEIRPRKSIEAMFGLDQALDKIRNELRELIQTAVAA